MSTKMTKSELVDVATHLQEYADDPVSKTSLAKLDKKSLIEIIDRLQIVKKQVCKIIKDNIKSPKSNSSKKSSSSSRVNTKRDKDCEDYKVSELRELAKSRDKKVGGTKSDLCERLNISHAECELPTKKSKGKLVKSESESEPEYETDSESERDDDTSKDELKIKLTNYKITKLKYKAKKHDIDITGLNKEGIIKKLYSYYKAHEEPELEEHIHKEHRHKEDRLNESKIETEDELTTDDKKEIDKFIREIIAENDKQNIVLSNENLKDLVKTKFDVDLEDESFDYLINKGKIYLFGNFISYLTNVKSRNKISLNEYINKLRLKEGKDIKFTEFKTDHDGSYIVDKSIVLFADIVKLDPITDYDQMMKIYLEFAPSLTNKFETTFGDDLDAGMIWAASYIRLHNPDKEMDEILNHIKKDGIAVYNFMKTLLTINKDQFIEYLEVSKETGVICEDLYVTLGHYSVKKLKKIADEYIKGVRSVNTYFKKCIGGKCKLDLDVCIQNQANKKIRKQENIEEKKETYKRKKLEHREHKIEQAKGDLKMYEKPRDVIYPQTDLVLHKLGRDKVAENKFIAESKANIREYKHKQTLPINIREIAHCLKIA